MSHTKLVRVADWAVRIGAILAAFVFLSSGLVYLYLGRWTAIDQDFWWIYDFCFNHTWLQSALWKFNNHLLFFPTFFWLADLKFFHGSQLVLFLAGLVLLLFTSGILITLIWIDKTVGSTARIAATLVLIVGNFWMARAFMTASGGFNCMCSLVMAAAAVAFLLVTRIGTGSAKSLAHLLAIVCLGIIASFSFATGLAIWPTMLLLAWCLRLPKPALVLLIVASSVVVAIYILIPGWGGIGTQFRPPSMSMVRSVVVSFCQLLGSPICYAAFAWWPEKVNRALTLMLWFYAGVAGLIFAAFAVVPRGIRRNLGKSSLELTGFALLVFNLIAFALVVVGRADYFEEKALNFEVVTLRYVFWSSLFWTGLLLLAIRYAQSKVWSRWAAYLAALAIPVFVFPSHYRDGVRFRQRAVNRELGATSLLNAVRDPRQIGGGAALREPDLLYRVAGELRVRRLDMFAEGLQDWIGLNETTLFGGRRKPEGLKGQCRVAAVVQTDNGAPAARVIGEASKQRGIIPKRLVIVDPSGTICGVARSLPTSSFINRVFYLGKANSNTFLGYIRDYNPQVQYIIRSADGDALSEEAIRVQLSTSAPASS